MSCEVVFLFFKFLPSVSDRNNQSCHVNVTRQSKIYWKGFKPSLLGQKGQKGPDK